MLPTTFHFVIDVQLHITRTLPTQSNVCS